MATQGMKGNATWGRFLLPSCGLLTLSACAAQTDGDACRAARTMRSSPFSKESVLPLAIALEVPVIAGGGTRLPLKELLRFARRRLL
jgi:hypothetical protein